MEKTLFTILEREFLPNENCFLLFHAYFPQMETVTETS